jgi:hypothetical protein
MDHPRLTREAGVSTHSKKFRSLNGIEDKGVIRSEGSNLTFMSLRTKCGNPVKKIPAKKNLIPNFRNPK